MDAVNPITYFVNEKKVHSEVNDNLLGFFASQSQSRVRQASMDDSKHSFGTLLRESNFQYHPKTVDTDFF